MRSLYLLGLFLYICSCHSAFSQDEYTYKVNLLQESILRIDGSSNVKDFCCQWQPLYANRNMDVKILSLPSDAMQLNHGALKFPVDAFDCENRAMTSDFRRILKMQEYPFIYVEVLRVVPSVVSAIKERQWIAEVKFTISGVSKTKEILLDEVEVGTSTAEFEGRDSFKMSEFKIEPPSVLFGLIQVVDELTVVFDLKFEIQKSGTTK